MTKWLFQRWWITPRKHWITGGCPSLLVMCAALNKSRRMAPNFLYVPLFELGVSPGLMNFHSLWNSYFQWKAHKLVFVCGRTVFCFFTKEPRRQRRFSVTLVENVSLISAIKQFHPLPTTNSKHATEGKPPFRVNMKHFYHSYFPSKEQFQNVLTTTTTTNWG